MNNLTTRKIVLGLLMTLVLAFSVQGIAEAISYPTTSHKHVADYTNMRQVNSRTTISSSISLNNSNSVEIVTITPGTGVSIVSPIASDSAVTLTEQKRDENNALQNNANGRFFTSGGVDVGTSFRVTVRFTSVGERTVHIADGTSYMKVDPNDRPNLIADTDRDATKGDVTHTYYVAQQAPLAVRGTANVPLAGGLTEGYNTGDFGEYDKTIFAGETTNHYLVTYTVAGGGQVYIESPATSTRPASRKIARTTLETSSFFTIVLDQNGGSGDGTLGHSNMVTATVSGSTVSTTGVYIHGNPTLEVDFPEGTEKGSEDNPGTPGEVVQNLFTATVKDGRGRGVRGVVVKFGGATITGDLIFDRSNSGTLVQSKTNPARFDLIFDSANRQVTAGSGKIVHVRTDSSGRASVDYRFGSIGEDTIPVDVVNNTGNEPSPNPFTELTNANSIKAYSGSTAGTQLSFLRVQSDAVSVNTFNLYALVEYNGEPLTADQIGDQDDDILLAEEARVVFTTSDGTLTNTPADAVVTAHQSLNEDGPTVKETPNSNGIAQVKFVPDGSSNPQVTASLQEEVSPGSGIMRTVETVTFNVLGSNNQQQQQQQQRDDQQQQQQATNRLAISPTSISGDPGDTETITVTALDTANVAVTGVPVTLSLPSDFTTAGGSASSISGTTPFTSTLTLPNTAGTHIITATAGGYDSASTTVTVTAPTGPGTLTLTLGTRNGNQQTVTVRATRGGSPQNGVRFTITGGLISYSGVTGTTGSVTTIITLPTPTGSHTLTVSATDYSSAQATAGAPGQQGSTPPTTGPAGGADNIRVDGQRLRSGTVNEQLDAPLRVRVIDANGRGVANVRVTFRVLAPGRGTFPGARGSGRATQGETNRTGYASTNFTPTTEGNVTVRATAAGVRDPVSFIIDVSEATDTGSPGPGVTPSREISPVVHVGAANRPPMLWVDSGKIYALVGANVQEFASGVEGAMNIAVGGGKVYWTEMTGESAGTINSAKLDGSGVKELKKIKAVPIGIAVDTAGDKLYWTNSRGRIQSADLDGSGIENVMLDLPGPMDIAVARGILYWTEYDATEGEGNVGIVNPAAGRKVARYISTGSDMPGSIVIGGNTVYWTEMTGSNSGTINSANLNGSGASELNDIRAVPIGIGVDTARSKLYWTNSRGRIQSANLNGSKIQNVVDGLGNPGDMVLSNSIAAPAPGAASTGSGTTASNKYDVNGDGVVDGKDKVLVLDAVMAGTYIAKYDVNDDKKLDILDYVLVDVEVDSGAAGAPALLGMKLSAIQIDRLQEQIDLLIATGDRSPAAIRTLIYLQQLIVMARPEKTQLLANYPNPFNPETWIPYELATDTTVKITIYNTQGVVIRTLELGHQSAGYYTGRDRAAYWDGRNAFGEQVASGIYFYQFETDAMSSMRKMVILK